MPHEEAVVVADEMKPEEMEFPGYAPAYTDPNIPYNADLPIFDQFNQNQIASSGPLSHYGPPSAAVEEESFDDDREDLDYEEEEEEEQKQEMKMPRGSWKNEETPKLGKARAYKRKSAAEMADPAYQAKRRANNLAVRNSRDKKKRDLEAKLEKGKAAEKKLGVANTVIKNAQKALRNHPGFNNDPALRALLNYKP